MKKYVKEYKGCKVPKGATHYLPLVAGYREGFAKLEDACWLFCNAGDSAWCGQAVFQRSCHPHAIELPEAPQDWMPEVGVECEVMTGPLEWSECIADYIGSEFIVYTANSVEGSSIKKFFRPLKTQQEKDREAFIKLALKLGEQQFDKGISIDDVYGNMFDKGFTAPKAGD